MNDTKTIPVILDTDIGSDIDDTWALLMLLNSPELDIKLISTERGDTDYRARIVARMLELAGRTDIPVAAGIPDDIRSSYGQRPWVEEYPLSRYPGTVHDDGVTALVDTIMQSPEPITLICIGPVPNVAAALDKEPRIAAHARFVGMHGSVHRGHRGAEGAIAEWNVRADPPAARKCFEAAWDMTITPLDTCGNVVLDGELYQEVFRSEDPLVRALVENYRIWCAESKDPEAYRTHSSILFDTVAIYLSFCEDLLVMQDLPLRVTDEGFTVVDDAGGKTIRTAIDWKDFDAYKRFLVDRLIG